MTRTERDPAMRLAVLSDLHANLPALEAVLADARRRGADRFLCLGDIVGCGPQPEECVRLIRDIGAVTVLGNHDAWALRPAARMPRDAPPAEPPGLRPAGPMLKPASRAWLRRLPHVAQAHGVALVHGSFCRPEQWPYLDSAAAARASFARQLARVAFFGHTHAPGLWEEGGDRFITPEPGREIRLGTERRCALNPGSVGNPRTPPHATDPRAQYLIFDTDRLGVTFHRVAYDVAACVAAMRAVGLPEEMLNRVELGY